MTPRAVLFDAAGTLIELSEPLGETYARTAREFGVELPAWRIAEAFGRILRRAEPMVFPGEPREQIARAERDWWRAIVRSTFLAADSTARFSNFDAFFERLYAWYSAPASWRPRAGAAESLDTLRAQGITTGVVSNFDQRLRGLLAGLELADRFDTVVLPADAGVAKPHPRIFELALERIPISAEQAVFVGDDAEKDLEGARRVGMRTIDVSGLATLLELPDRLEALQKETPHEQ